METFTTREQIIEIVNKLFVFTDHRKWSKLQDEVFTKEIMFDMTSLGGEARNMPASEVCETWQKGFEGIDSVNHLAGNYLVTVNNDATADVFAYATATHYKAAAINGKTRTFVGTYDLHLVLTTNGWRMSTFKYNLSYVDGNMDLI